MARYSAEESKSMEYQGADTFRIEKDGGRAQVVFLYTDEKSIDGWSCHRLPGANFYTYTVDCPRGPKDPVDVCPACKAGEAISTRVFVRMLDVATGKMMIWDKPASFRKELAGYMHYHNPLYGQKFEITRTGSGLNTRYSFMPIGESGITPEQYEEYSKQCDEVCDSYVRPVDKYEEIKARSVAAQNEQVNVDAQQAAPQQNAWGQNQAPQGAQQGWGAAPSAPQQGWGQAPAPAAPAPQQSWGSTPAAPTPQASTQPSGSWAPQGQTQQGWGQTQPGAWSQNPSQN